jgi:hypothetical protein
LKPAAYDLPITRGDDYTLPLNVRGRDAQGNKTTISLAGYTVEAKLIYSDGTTSIITANWLSQSTGSLELIRLANSYHWNARSWHQVVLLSNRPK